MFEVVRYLGPDAATGVKPKDSVQGTLTLQQLNARARERAESRRSRVSAVSEMGLRTGSGEVLLRNTDTNGVFHVSSAVVGSVNDEAKEDVERVPKKGKKRKIKEENGNASIGVVDVSSAGAVETVCNNVGKDAVLSPEIEKKKKKKKKKRQEIDEVSNEVEDDVTEKNDRPVPHLEPKVKKSEKRKGGAEERHHSLDEIVQPEELAEQCPPRELEVPNMGNGESSAIEKRKRKKKRRNEPESDLELRIDTAETTEEFPPMPELMTPPQ